jgi:hypothetical protein
MCDDRDQMRDTLKHVSVSYPRRWERGQMRDTLGCVSVSYLGLKIWEA